MDSAAAGRHLLFASFLIVLTAPYLQAQALTLRGDHFAIDGQGRFLVFVWYFDGVRRIPADDPGATAILDRDLDYFASKGVAGIRIWPNTAKAPAETLMQCDGTLKGRELQRLRTLIARAALKGLVVDVTLTHEHVRDAGGKPCLTLDTFTAGVAAVTMALRGQGNVLFDLQNEWNVPRSLTLTESDIARLRQAVKALDPGRLVTASTSDHGEQPAADHAKTASLDLLAFHDPRSAGWEDRTAPLVRRLKSHLADRPPASSMPVYLQEPSRCGYAAYSDCDPAHYQTAVRNARIAGAAAWTLHTNPDQDLSGTAPIESLLTDSEKTVLDNLKSTLEGVSWGVLTH